jgi:hypothetical protein
MPLPPPWGWRRARPVRDLPSRVPQRTRRSNTVSTPAIKPLYSRIYRNEGTPASLPKHTAFNANTCHYGLSDFVVHDTLLISWRTRTPALATRSHDHFHAQSAERTLKPLSSQQLPGWLHVGSGTLSQRISPLPCHVRAFTQTSWPQT